MIDNNLWGEIPEINVTESPILVLREQADILTDITKGKIHAKVRSGSSQEEGMYTSLYLTVPYLGDFRVNILYMTYGIGYFPLQVYNEVGNPTSWSVHNMDEFKVTLMDILQSPKVKDLIRQILNHIAIESLDQPF